MGTFIEKNVVCNGTKIRFQLRTDKSLTIDSFPIGEKEQRLTPPKRMYLNPEVTKTLNKFLNNNNA